jgi:hypothetical protein
MRREGIGELASISADSGRWDPQAHQMTRQQQSLDVHNELL